MNKISVYGDKKFILTTKHEKNRVMAPIIESKLGAILETVSLDTDHALIVKPNCSNQRELIFKGINHWDDLEIAFRECLDHASDNQVLIQTDMRAHLNPTRMKVIKSLTEKLVEKLSTNCPSCQSPGWGKVGVKPGLPCMECQHETEMIAQEIMGCPGCEYQEFQERSDGLAFADPMHCSFCNP